MKNKQFIRYLSNLPTDMVVIHVKLPTVGNKMKNNIKIWLVLLIINSERFGLEFNPKEQTLFWAIWKSLSESFLINLINVLNLIRCKLLEAEVILLDLIQSVTLIRIILTSDSLELNILPRSTRARTDSDLKPGSDSFGLKSEIIFNFS